MNYVTDRPPACRGRPLWLCRLARQRVWWFASSAEFFFEAFHAVLGDDARGRIDYLAPVPESVPLMLAPDGSLLAPGAWS